MQFWPWIFVMWIAEAGLGTDFLNIFFLLLLTRFYFTLDRGGFLIWRAAVARALVPTLLLWTHHVLSLGRTCQLVLQLVKTARLKLTRPRGDGTYTQPHFQPPAMDYLKITYRIYLELSQCISWWIMQLKLALILIIFDRPQVQNHVQFQKFHLLHVNLNLELFYAMKAEATRLYHLLMFLDLSILFHAILHMIIHPLMIRHPLEFLVPHQCRR